MENASVQGPFQISIKSDTSPDYNNSNHSKFKEHYARLMFECQRKQLSFDFGRNALNDTWHIKLISHHDSSENYEIDGVLLSTALKNAIYHAEERVKERG